MKATWVFLFAIATSISFNVIAKDNHVSDQVIEQQRQNLAKNTEGKGFGPAIPS